MEQTITHLAPVVILLSASLGVQQGRAETKAEIPFEAALRKADVVLSSMADGQRESLLVGNGDLYGIVWEKAGGLYMRVTKNDIWDARVDTSEDGELPRVNIGDNSVSGAVGAPPSYKKLYPQPRCAAALRIGGAGPANGARWTCIRQAADHGFVTTDDELSATMHVGGTAGASTGYRATLPDASEASTVCLKLRGSANSSYYVNVYNKDHRNILASGWKPSPISTSEVQFPFDVQAVLHVELYAMTADGERAENVVESLSLRQGDEETRVLLPSHATPLEARLDLQRAVASIDRDGDQKTSIRVLADRNVVLIRCAERVTLEEITAATLPRAVTGETDGISWLRMEMPGDLDYAGMSYALAVAAKEELKAVSIVSSFDLRTGDVRDAAIALAKRTLAEKESDLINRHETVWNQYWAKSGIELADDVLQRWWYRMLYFAQTISRPGAAPPGLMPPLATDATPWHADFHFNYNSWQPFYSVISANHPELADSWIGYVHSLLPRAKWLAREAYNCEGVFYSISQFLHEPDPAVCRSKNRRQLHMNPWGLTIGMVGMTAQNLWHRHRCQPDQDYLEAKIYPTLREAARFYVSFMEQCRRDEKGKVLLGPSYSPEHGPFGIANCPFDVAYVHYTFDAFCSASEELGQDADLAAKCRAMKALLADYPVAADAEGRPVVVDWEGCEHKQVKVHNITVPAAPVFPAEQVSWFSPEPVKQLFRRTIKETRFNGNNSHIMFNIARARLSMPEAVTATRTWFTSRELPNGLFVWQGHAHGTFMPESIGVAAVITELLMQSVGDTIRVFPCWPDDQDARFNNLRAQGGFLVSAQQKDGVVRQVTIESTVGGKLRLLSPWPKPLLQGDGDMAEPLQTDRRGVIEIDTLPGKRFEFRG